MAIYTGIWGGAIIRLHMTSYTLLYSSAKAEQQNVFVYHNIQLYKSESLGCGSYGGVCKARCDGLLCAAKIMHPTLFDLHDSGTVSYLCKFQEECHLLSLARHPNVVQYLATYYDPDTRLPVLLMELCDESLTVFLERSPGPLSYHLQINICLDIVLALVYLHSNGLIHRDLTGNNVLMIAGSRAKITDFGMSKLATGNPRMTALTLCPGNLLYMSPEALDETKSYTAKLDIFSFGVIVIQILTRQFPSPIDRFRIVYSSQFDEEVRVLVPETERRQTHLQLIPDIHSLKPLALQCLQMKESLRPSALQLSESLSEMKQAPQYIVSMHEPPTKDEIQQCKQVPVPKPRKASVHQARIKELERIMEAKDRQLQENQQIIEARERELQENLQIIESIDRELQDKQWTIEENQNTIATKQHAIETNERQLQQTQQQLRDSLQLVEQLNQSLQHKDKTISDLRQTISHHERDIQQLRQQDIASSVQLPVTAEKPQAATAISVAQKDIRKMTWGEEKKAQNSSEIQQLEKQFQGQIEAKTREASEHQTHSTQLQRMVEAKDRQLQEKEKIVGAKDRELLEKQQTIEENQNTIATKQHAIDIKERQLQQTQQELEDSQQLLAQFQHSLQHKDNTISDLQQTISHHEREIQQLKEQDIASSIQSQLLSVRAEKTQTATAVSVAQKDISKMTWREGKKAPEGMARGAAVVDGNTAYFRPDGTGRVYSYQNILGNEHWFRLPDNPYKEFGLAVIDGLLTSVGGWNSRYATNTLLSLTGEGERKQWSEVLPPMPTPRRRTAPITTEQALVIAGGIADDELSTVEVMDINTKQWTTVCPLPRTLRSLSGVVCGNSLYLAGGFIGRYGSKSVFTCSLSDLWQPETLGSRMQETLTRQSNVWKVIRSLPVTDSTLASFGGYLLAIGGRDNSGNPTTDVYRYDSLTESWPVFSQMKKKRSVCLAVTLSEGQHVIVGGWTHGYINSDSVEILEGKDSLLYT